MAANAFRAAGSDCRAAAASPCLIAASTLACDLTKGHGLGRCFKLHGLTDAFQPSAGRLHVRSARVLPHNPGEQLLRLAEFAMVAGIDHSTEVDLQQGLEGRGQHLFRRLQRLPQRFAEDQFDLPVGTDRDRQALAGQDDGSRLPGQRTVEQPIQHPVRAGGKHRALLVGEHAEGTLAVVGSQRQAAFHVVHRRLDFQPAGRARVRAPRQGRAVRVDPLDAVDGLRRGQAVGDRREDAAPSRIAHTQAVGPLAVRTVEVLVVQKDRTLSDLGSLDGAGTEEERGRVAEREGSRKRVGMVRQPAGG